MALKETSRGGLTKDEGYNPKLFLDSLNRVIKPVVLVDGDGSSLAPVSDTSKKYEDTSFGSGEDQRVLDFNTDLSRNATVGYIIIDGPGNIGIEISPDGTNYGDVATLRKNDKINLAQQISINKVRLTWIADTAYRVNVA